MAKRAKYNNTKTGGFDSKKESAYSANLDLLRNATEDSERVTDIQRQVRYLLIPSQKDETGKVIERPCHYVADFVVTYADGHVDVIDVKSAFTKKLPVYIIKRKLLFFTKGIRIKEV
jgi:hypothetical protein